MQGNHRFLKHTAGILAGLSVCMALWTADAYAAPSNADPVAFSADQAGRMVTGKVVDEAGVPVPGAILVVTGNNNINTTTDIDGSFAINAPSGFAVQVICVGYLTETFTAQGQSGLVIKLKSDIQSLDEAVAIGYGTQKKATLTGAISNINEKAIQATTATGVATKLQGKVSGLNIRNNQGTPGQFDMNINIRGFGYPLFVIDGINRTAADFHRLNPEDIESISVLKDASAAIYGLNAANGVILVTTKKGRSGRSRFQFNANFGMSAPADQVRMANGYEYYYLRNAANINMGNTEFISAEELEKWRTGEYTGTDWAAETFNKASMRQEYSLSADGGNEKVQYYFNINYIDDAGILKSGDLYYNKWSFRSSITAQLARDLTATVNVGGYLDKYEAPISGFFNIWRGTVASLPYKPVYANNNPLYYNAVKDGQSYNPVALSYSSNTGYTRAENNSIQTNFNLSYTPVFAPGLVLSGTLAFDKRFAHNKSILASWKMYDYDEVTDTYSSEEWNSRYRIDNSYGNPQYLTSQIQATYKKTIADAHHLGIMAAFETRAYDYDHDNISKYYDFYTSDQLDYASETDMVAGGNFSQARNMSYISRFNYDYKEKYLLEIAARYDGSYRYHPNVRWGLFPVVSAGWRISEEPFMKGVTWLSNLKLRASAGQIGEDTGAAFQYIAGFSMSGGGWTAYNHSSTTEGVIPPALTNETMTWTKSNIYDIGLDLGFLDNRLTFTADVFRKHKTGILAYRNVSFPDTFGAAFPQENLNSNRTEGIELSAGCQSRIGEFFYNIQGNFTYANTRNMYVEHTDYTSQNSRYWGGVDYRSANMAFVYNVIGQFQSQEEIDNYAVYSTSTGMRYVLPGDYIYEDVNGDGVIDPKDTRPLVYTPGADPVYNYGLTLSGSWRGLDFSILLQGAAGFTTYHSLSYTIPFWAEGNIPAWYMNSWHHEDPYDSNSPWVPGELPAVRATDLFAPYLLTMGSTKSFMDCSYVRLKNVEIGYTFSQSFLQRAHIERVRLFVSGNNLYTLCDKYVKAYDPETVSGSYNTGWVYPLMRTFNAGVNLYF